MIKNQNYLMHRKKQDKLIENYRRSIEYVKQKENQLISENDVYGIQTPFDEYGSQRLQYQWKIHQNCNPKQPAVDFKKVNKNSLNNNQERKNLAQNTQNLETIQKGSKHYDIYLPEYGYMYGLLNKPSTPIQNVLGGKYGNDFDSRQNEVNKYYRQQLRQSQTQKQMLMPIKDTHASKLFKEQQFRTTKTLEKEKPMFKLNRFKNVSSVLNSRINSKMSSQLNFNKKALQSKSQHQE